MNITTTNSKKPKESNQNKAIIVKRKIGAHAKRNLLILKTRL